MDKKRSLRDVAIRILGESPSPMRPGGIVGRAIAAGMLSPAVSYVRVVVRDILDYDVEHNGDRSAFVRTPSGDYGLSKSRAAATDAGAAPRAAMTMSVMEAAATVLEGALGPLPLEMIVGRAVSEGLISPTPRMLSLVLEEAILQEIHHEGSQSRFVRTKMGRYGLRSRQGRYSHPGADSPHIADGPLPLPFPRARYDSESASAPATHDNDPDLTSSPIDPVLAKPSTKKPRHEAKPPPSSDYAGKGGEHLVASKLLFLKHDVSVPIVDAGTDLITTRSFGHSFIQVKTATLKGNSYRIGIRIASFRKNAGKSMFYVFVLRQPAIPGSPERFLFFPHGVLENYIAHEHIQQGHKNVSIKLTEEGGKLLLGQQKLDVSYYRDNWGQFLPAGASGDP